jgi:hypothetical protein
VTIDKGVEDYACTDRTTLNHLAVFLKPILNFPNMILVWHSGHDWPAVDERLDGLIAVAHGKEY